MARIVVREDFYDKFMREFGAYKVEKSHKYSRKEFKDGEWRYYYDKHGNLKRLMKCKSEALKIEPSMTTENIIFLAENYIKNIWQKDWAEHPEKSVCQELNGKRIVFSDISFKHVSNAGENRKRSRLNLLTHVSYLPCAKELLEKRGIKTQSRYKELEKPMKDGTIGLVYETVSGLAPDGDRNRYVQVTVSRKKFRNGKLGDTVYISVMGTENIKKSLV